MCVDQKKKKKKQTRTNTQAEKGSESIVCSYRFIVNVIIIMALFRAAVADFCLLNFRVRQQLLSYTEVFFLHTHTRAHIFLKHFYNNATLRKQRATN